MATGLLILGLGPSTRLLTFIVGLSKEYVATIRLGSSSTTDDAEGDLLGFAPQAQLDRVTDELIAEGIIPLTGEIEQVPSTVSAIKVGGKRAYALARAGETVELKARAVTIYAFDVQSITRGSDEEGNGFIDVEVRVECSSGTYIRALARDLGFKLGLGGHLTALRRTRIGSFHVTDAHDLDKLESAPELMSPADVARGIFSAVDLNETQAVELSQGKKVLLEGYPDSKEPVAAIGPGDRLVGLVTVKKNQTRVVVNFPTETEGS
jgi:tRNA pseudouridine55 synthase